MSKTNFNPKPMQVSVGNQSYSLIAFYYDGKNGVIDKGSVDDIFQAYYLANFYQVDDSNKIKLDINGITASFYTAEAAFQATKWWHDDTIRKQFEQANSGSDAYKLSKNLTISDSNYAGLGPDGAMYNVLMSKFSQTELQNGLLATDDAYLLEHNPVKGRDKKRYWSDDYDGAGKNMLGKTLMKVRAVYGGKPAPCDDCDVKNFSTAVNEAANKASTHGAVGKDEPVVPPSGKLTIIASVFHKGGEVGDFKWMINNPDYKDAFFIFNDNKEEFQIHHDDPNDPAGCHVGGGNAAIRPWQCKTPPQAAGIPTGPNFTGLTAEVQQLIDLAVNDIRANLKNTNYQRIIFSSDGNGGLGTGIFEVPEEVKKYIVKQIYSLA
jgi:predicted NAD-dependent protein-ADP-ribosyltransferase YbiA (DUF1768 family)